VKKHAKIMSGGNNNKTAKAKAPPVTNTKTSTYGTLVDY